MNIEINNNNYFSKIIQKYIEFEDNYEFEAIIDKKINTDQLYKLLGSLKYKYPDNIKKYVYLNVSHNNIRATIDNLDNVKEFYNNEDINKHNKFLIKNKIDRYIDKDYNIKFNLKTENIPSNIDINTFKNNYKSINKIYRFIERYSFITEYVRYDISIVKTSNGNVLKDTNLFNKPPEYEIELEYLNHNNTIQNIITNLYNNIFFTLQIINNTPFILKNNHKSLIYNEYISLVSYIQLGPKVIGMSKNTIRNIEQQDILEDKYMITPKADGLKHILFINKNGFVYLIDSNKNVIDTNLISNSFNTVIDGEFIDTYNSSTTLFNISFNNTYLNHIFSYQAFDIYYLNGEIVYNIELIQRINLINSIEFHKNTPHALNFNVKPFYNINQVSDIINNDKNKNYGFNIDGIIFQPIEPYNNITVMNKNNYKILKWKPEKYNSIDFLINISIENNKYLITFNSQYSFNLFNKNITALKPFSSIKPYIYNIHQQYHNVIPTTEDGIIIQNNTIVECRFDINSHKWIFMRNRTDKTILYNKGVLKSTANNIWVANDIFSSIFSPITVEDISDKQIITQFIEQSSNYYYNFKQTISDRTDLQKFHNTIKKNIIQNSVKHLSNHSNFIKCLDLGIGHGGDIKKYVNTNHHNYNPNNKLQNGISFILGIEFNINNIEHYHFQENKYGSRAKFLNICTEYSNSHNTPDIINNKNCYILQGDLNADILKKNTKLFLNQYDNDTFNLLYDKFNFNKNPFELIVSNFSFHYFVQNQQKYNNILKTISNNLLDNHGLFIVTFLDSQRIIELFNKEKTNTVDCGFAIIKKIDEFNKKKFGTKISIKLKTMETEELEYLVDFDTLVEQCNKHKLYLSNSNYINEDINKQGFFSDIHFKYPYNLGNDIKYSHLHRYAIFKKNTKIINNLKSIVNTTKKYKSKSKSSSSSS